ncbi:MAG: protease HtpX [Pseudomonadales bacterium]
MRILLFLATNFAVVIVASMTLRLLGMDRILDESGTGLNYNSLLVFCAVIGMGGSLVSLALSKWMAKRSTGAQIIESPSNASERWLLETVSRQAQDAGIGVPEVAVFNSPQPNAFATGANRNNALVAVSTGLLQHMSKAEVEAVLGHEIGHVANGDMITLSLIQGVVNTFVLFFARIVGFFVDRVVLKNERGLGIGYWLSTMAAEVVFGLLASAIVMWFSRRREFRADAAGASLAGRENMINALARLKAASQMQPALPESMAAFGITGGLRQGLRALFTSHPPLDERIQALRSAV